MHLGIDFDNTIVCYDGLFHAIASERGWVDPSVPPAKDAVRNHLRAAGREEGWIELQGLVYGSRILEAPPFPGALDFLRNASTQNLAVTVISHKTRSPFAGPKADLHEAARAWLAHHRLADAPAFFELTKTDKLARIAAQRCDLFIDDLPEFLAESAFPRGVARILFDPNRQHSPDPRWKTIRSWDQAMSLTELKNAPKKSPA